MNERVKNWPLLSSAIELHLQRLKRIELSLYIGEAYYSYVVKQGVAHIYNALGDLLDTFLI